jgi:hypothetical protein
MHDKIEWVRMEFFLMHPGALKTVKEYLWRKVTRAFIKSGTISLLFSITQTAISIQA